MTEASHRCAGARVADALGENGLQCLFPDGERLFELCLTDHERDEHTDAVRIDPRLQQQEPALRGRMEAWQERWVAIGDVRGLGAMLAIELVQDRAAKEPAAELA